MEVRGGDFAETMIDTDGPDHKVLQIESTLNIGTSGGDCQCRVPQTARISFENVGGDMHIKDIAGSIHLARLGGDFATRRTCGLTLGTIGGDADMREIDGDLNLQAVNGDVVVQDVSGRVVIGTISDDCVLKNIPAGFDIGSVGGDLEIRTALYPGAHGKAFARGEIGFEFPAESSIRIVMPSDTELTLDEELTAFTEGDQLIVTVGSGEATVELSARDSIRVSMDRGKGRGPSQDFDAYMMDVSAQIDMHLRGLEQHLDDLPERVRHGVERRINEAMRQVQFAERAAQRSADRGNREAWNFNASGSGEPVSENERIAILKMVEEGKITVAEAQKLLAALDGEE
jgi:hypothetical protein